MASATNLLSPTLTTVRGQLRDLRERQTKRQLLRREIAAYTSDNDLNDLEAILARHSDAETAEIRRILAGRRGF
jgi:hypothetical protein